MRLYILACLSVALYKVPTITSDGTILICTKVLVGGWGELEVEGKFLK